MILKEVLKKLEFAENPVVQVIQKTDCGKVIVIGLKKGVILKEHKTDVSARLMIIKGTVTYKEENHQEDLDVYDEKIIPIEIIHSLEAKEDSLCLLFK